MAALALSGCTSSHQAAPSTPTSSSSAPATCSTVTAPGLSGAGLPFGTAAPTGPSSALQVSAGQPVVSSLPSGRDGYRLVEVPVTASVRTNGTFAIDQSQFVLVGPDNRSCSRPSINPLSHGFIAITVDESRSGAGSVAFLVPASISTTRLSVRYLPAVGARSASLAWLAGATAPKPVEPVNGCDGGKSSYTTTGVRGVAFGTQVKHGDSVVSSTVSAATPTRRAFSPGPSQPNDVDAIDVKLHVSASGADAFVDRRSFVLVDGSGRLCRRAALSSEGETLTSALVKAGRSADYTLVFWAPKGGTITGLRLLQLTKPGGTVVQSDWYDAALKLRPIAG
ncbi:hypothetical protein EFY87_13165 [Flexivirga caeni]|uniref:DUF4232 domain-containing protein n=1 Tax=Flexivirga caeni TaxID=2294115 RepID=A0A3M9M5N9_9MICO|nr:hypothetical protein EFY87_13165 [Flexivirga caeni]